MNNKYKELDRLRTKGTCRWLLNSGDFRAWMAELPKSENPESRVLLLTGKPGCGKSFQMKAAVETVIPSASPQHVLVYFWFDAASRKEDLSNSGIGFFRAMLHQLLKVLNDDIRALIALEKTLSKTTNRNLAASDVRNDIVETLRYMQPADITIFLDGLDDCTVGSTSREEPMDFVSREQKTDVFSVLEFLRDLPSETGSGVRLCLSARSPTFLGDIIEPKYTVPVDERNGGDILTYLQGTLTGKKMMERPRLRQTLLHLVYKRASNTFLWARLVVAQIEQKMTGNSIEEIISFIKFEPTDLFQLYRSLLSHVDKNDRATIQKEAEVLIHMLLVAARGLSMKEVGSLLNFATGGNSEQEISESHIAKVSCGLVECQLDNSDPNESRKVVRFIHGSVARFVLEEQDTIFSNPDRTQAAQARFHFQAFRICSRMIQSEIDNNPKEKPAFLAYAKQFWMHHARKGEAAMADYSAEKCEKFIKRCGMSSVKAAKMYKDTFISGRDAFLGMPIVDVPNEDFIVHVDCLLVLLAFEGCKVLVSLHLKEECDSCCGAYSDADKALLVLQQAVFLAALRGYDETVGELLDAADRAGLGAANAINAHYEGKETALRAAVFWGHEKVVRLLMKRGANAEIEDGGGDCDLLPLHVAVSHEDVSMIQILLEKPQRERQPALQVEVVRKQHIQMVDALLKQKNHDGFTALHLAIRRGASNVFEKLIECACQARVPLSPLLQQENYQGQNALYIAIHYGVSDVIEKVLTYDYGAEFPLPLLLQQKDHEGDTVMHLAIQVGASDVLEKLLKCAEEDSGLLIPLLHQENHEGDTVLHLAIQLSASDALEKLLKCACDARVPLLPILQQENYEGYTVLHLAIVCGASDALEKLLKRADDAGVPIPPLLTQSAGCGTSPYKMCKDMVYEPEDAELAAHMIDVMERRLPKG